MVEDQSTVLQTLKENAKMKKYLLFLIIFKTILGYCQYDYFIIEKPKTQYNSPYMFDVQLKGLKNENGIYIPIEKSIKKIEEFSFENMITIRILKEIEANRQFLNKRFEKVYKLIDQSNQDGYLRPDFLSHTIESSIHPRNLKKRIIRVNDKMNIIYIYDDKPMDLTSEQIKEENKIKAISRLGLLDLAINHIGKNNTKQVDIDILEVVKIMWICDGDLCQEERLKEDNLTIEWVLSLFARKEAFKAMGWEPMYDDGTVPKEPVQKEEPEIDPDEITITF